MHLLLLVIPIIAFIVSFSLAIIVLSRDYRKPTHQLFATFLVGSGLWGLLIFAFRVSPDVEHARFWISILPIANAVTSAIFLHFSFLHTRSRVSRWILAALYIPTALTIALTSTGMIVKDITSDVFGFLPIYTPFNQVTTLTSYIFILIGIANFVIAYRKSISYEERNSYLYILVGIGLSLAGGIIDYISTINIGVPPVGLIGNILFGALTTIAVLKYHLLDINLVIRKSIAYLLTSTITAILPVGIIVIFNHFFGQGNLTIWMYLVLLLVLAIILQLIWQRMQTLVDRWFFRERYDFLKELEQFSLKVHDISDLQKLGMSLVDLIGHAIQITSVHLFMTTEQEDFNLIASTKKEVEPIKFQSNSSLIRWMNKSQEILHRQQIDLIPQLQSLTIRERDLLTEMGAELFIPLKTNKEELVGLLILGKKRSEQLYSGDDERRIITVANRVAIELENARLYAREATMRMDMQRQNEQKTEFLHQVAHELKTPLTAIISSSELINSEGLVVDEEQRSRLMGNINRSAWLMDRRVGELLDLARIQIGTLELKLEPLDVGVLTRDLVSQLSALFKNKEQTVSVHAEEPLPKAKGDKERIEEVLINILSNANKFSPAQGKISVRVSAMVNKVMVEVEDSAPKITEEDKPRLFNAYYRGGNSEDRQRISGLGLGLAISKSLISLHHGEIGIRSDSPRGNIFFFSLPIWGIGDEKQDTQPSNRTPEGG